MRAASAAGPSAPERRQLASKKIFVVRANPRTGKLCRVAITVKPAEAAIPGSISEIVDRSARAHDVDPLLVRSIISVESNFDPGAVSPKGAKGLMQLMPPTARMLGVSNSFDPGQNIEAGVKYFKYLQDLYKDDRLALAAYNAGPGAVEKYNTIPPYPETQNYVEKVGKRYQEARKAAAAQPPAQQPAPAAQVAQTSAEDTHHRYPKLEHFVDADGRLYLSTAR